MIIRTMTAAFGRLNGDTLTLEPGLNLIQAANEEGKSTWAAFLKAMLYGIDTRDRDKKGYLADKNRYQPWNGTPMAGEMTLEWRGRSITIRRGPKGNTPFGTFSAVYTGTEEPVPGMTGDNCGAMLLGVSREVFERSAFLGQGGSLAVTSTPELERRIAALVSSGQEDVSFSQAQRQLKDWLNRRKVNKSVGRIPQLEGELTQLSASLAEAEEINGELNRWAARQKALERQRRELEAEMEIHDRLARRGLNRRYAQAQEKLTQAQEQMDAVQRERARMGTLPTREALKRAQGELAFLKALEPELRQGEEALAQAEQALEQARQRAQDDRFHGMTGEEALEKGEKDAAAYREALSRQARSKRIFALLQGVGVGLAVLVALLQPLVWRGAVAYLVCAALSAVALSAGKGQGRAAQAILSRYGAAEEGDILSAARDYHRRTVEAEQAARELQTIRGGLADRQARQENSREDLFRFVHAFAPEVRDLFGCSAALSRALNLEERESVARAQLEGAKQLRDALAEQGGQETDTLEQLDAPRRTVEETAAELGSVQAQLEQADRALHMARGRQESVGDPAALAARREELAEELERRNREVQAITIAMEALEEANVQMQERFSPALSRRAGELFSRLTDGSYGEVSLNRELEASVTAGRDILPHKALYLSKGTVDQLYLAVRLAVYDLCLEEEPVPMVLDDALAAFDDRRMGLALELLAQRGKEGQILLFTCQSREGEYLTGREGVSQGQWRK